MAECGEHSKASLRRENELTSTRSAEDIETASEPDTDMDTDSYTDKKEESLW